MQVVIDAQQAKLAAEYGKPVNWKTLLDIGYVTVLFLLMIGAAIRGHAVLGILIFAILYGLAGFRARLEYLTELRPYIDAVLKARKTGTRTK